MGTATGARVGSAETGKPDQDLNLTSLSRFAKFFKAYMGVMPLFLAALAPVLTIAKVIPVYDQQSRSLATYTGLLGFLMVAWVFYLRHPIARLTLTNDGENAVFRIVRFRWLPSRSQALRGMMYVAPFFLICASAYCFILYNVAVGDSVAEKRILMVRKALGPTSTPTNGSGAPASTSGPVSAESILSNMILQLPKGSTVPTNDEALSDKIFPMPNSLRLMLDYLGIFLFAELAFFVMALREYLQSLLAISDQALIEFGPRQSELLKSIHLYTADDPVGVDVAADGAVPSKNDLAEFAKKLKAANLVNKF